MAQDDDLPYWVLISVLFSTFSLQPELAQVLHRIAFDLLQSGASEAAVDLPLALGVVRNLKKDALLGTVGGPTFEAELETEQGKGQVRFLLTRSGLELFAAREAGTAPGAPPKREWLH